MKCILACSGQTRSSTCLASYKKCEQVSVWKVYSGSIPLHTTNKMFNYKKYITMMIKSKTTGRDISTEYLALLSGLITNDEFELITLTIK